jgi:hypothetical protein
MWDSLGGITSGAPEDRLKFLVGRIGIGVLVFLVVIKIVNRMR